MSSFHPHPNWVSLTHPHVQWLPLMAANYSMFWLIRGILKPSYHDHNHHHFQNSHTRVLPEYCPLTTGCLATDQSDNESNILSALTNTPSISYQPSQSTHPSATCLLLFDHSINEKRKKGEAEKNRTERTPAGKGKGKRENLNQV